MSIISIKIIPKLILKNLLLNISEIATTPFQDAPLNTPRYNGNSHYSNDR